MVTADHRCGNRRSQVCYHTLSYTCSYTYSYTFSYSKSVFKIRQLSQPVLMPSLLLFVEVSHLRLTFFLTLGYQNLLALDPHLRFSAREPSLWISEVGWEEILDCWMGNGSKRISHWEASPINTQRARVGISEGFQRKL